MAALACCSAGAAGAPKSGAQHTRSRKRDVRNIRFKMYLLFNHAAAHNKTGRNVHRREHVARPSGQWHGPPARAMRAKVADGASDAARRPIPISTKARGPEAGPEARASTFYIVG